MRVNRGKTRLAAFAGPSPKTSIQTQKSRRYLLHKPSYSQICLKVRCHGNGGRSGKNAIDSIRWPIPENHPIGAKILQKSPTQAELQPILSQISLPWQRGSVGEKCNWQHSMAHPRNPPQVQKSRKNLLRKPSYSAFCPKFRCHGNGGRSGKNAISSIQWPIPETPLQAQKYRRNFLRKPSYSQFCPKFRCHGNEGRSGKNAIGSIRWPIPENPSIDAKISQISLTQTELQPILSQISLPWQPGRVRGKIK